MRHPKAPFTVWGQLITSVLCSIQILGAVGCNTNLGLTPADFSNPFGLLINADQSSNTLGAIRLPTGESVFVFGSYGSSGLIGRIDGAVLVDALGEESSVVFEKGLLKSARGSDGSSLTMTYDESSPQRISGRADIVFAALDDADRNQSVAFDIDLERAAADVAAEVRNLLGIEVSDAEPPDSPDGKRLLHDKTSDKLTVDPSAEIDPKAEIRSQLILIFAQFHAATFAALGYVVVEVVSALVGVAFNVVVTVVSAVTQAIVTAMFLPLILLGEVMRAAVSQPIRPLNFTLDIDIEIPRLPRS